MKKVNVLGTEYTIETHKISEDEYMDKEHLSGYCGEETKLIVIADMSEKKVFSGHGRKRAGKLLQESIAA